MRALLSTYDKTGIAELAKELVDLNCDLVSSGGTAQVIRESGLPVTDVAALTGVPAILGHRVVTLHPKIHGGLLADRDDPTHLADMETYGIEGFDIVVVNLYPFASEPSIELIDIGGPAMVRAAAKNHAHVAVVTDPADYATVLEDLETAGEVSPEHRRSLARKAFATTAAYDAQIVEWLDDDAVLPPTVHLALERVDELRYGENPHQAGARYRIIGESSWWDDVVQHSGLALSYLNLYDAAAAWELAHDLGDADQAATVAIIKHANPCGVAVADSLARAYLRAYECDERSAFGGIVALNREVDASTVERMVEAAQADVVIAPSYADGTIEALIAKRKNTRLLEAPPPTRAPRRELRQISGGYLAQSPHQFVAARDGWQVVTRTEPTPEQWADASLAWRVCGHVKSNSIVLAREGVAWGIGAGQQNRVEAGEIAAKKAAGRAEGGACASDAFYPFPDGIEAAAEAGVAVVIQPGGAMRDEQNIERADELGLAMIFTGERHFLH